MKHFKADILSGFVIFLIALPLSIGIALAAGAPASAGIMAAILGGIVGTFFTGAHVVINGPAAGLIVVVLGAIQALSDGDPVVGFKRMLAAVVVVGILQIITGALKLGRFAFLAPSSVVHGMLSAIGAIILIKQVPVILGVFPKSKTILGILSEIHTYIHNVDLPIALIGLSSLGVLIFWNNFAGDIKKYIPSSILVVALGLILATFFDVTHGHDIMLFNYNYHVGPEFLVHVPENISKMIILPQFDVIWSGRSLMAIFTLFIVSSVESLLSTYAVDKLDPQHRKSNFNKDLLGKGVVNLSCGLIGGYPVISEIVRSSANIANGAKTMWSNFFHGVFILVFVLFFPNLINHIPLAALAAVLMIVGFNLTHPKHFIAVYHHGKDQFLFFLTTFIITVVDDLLVGILAGIALKIVLHLVRGVHPKYFFNPQLQVQEKDDRNVVISLQSPVVFLGYLKVKSILDSHKDKNVQIVYNDKFVDFTIRELIKDTLPSTNFAHTH